MHLAMKPASLVGLILALTSMIGVAVVCGCGSYRIRALPNGKVLVSDFSIEAKRRLFTKVGFTNIAYCGYGERDSKGDRLCFPVEVHDEAGQRYDHLVLASKKRTLTKGVFC